MEAASGIVSINCKAVSRTTRKPAKITIRPTAAPPRWSAAKNLIGSKSEKLKPTNAVEPDSTSNMSLVASACIAVLRILLPKRRFVRLIPLLITIDTISGHKA